MEDVKWIKICTDIFDDEKILLIESLPEADSIIVIWFKLLCLAGKQNNSGVFLINDRIHYTDEMFATIFRRNLNTVRLALETFEQFGMIERIEGTVTIPKWEKHQQLDALEMNRAKTRKRVAKHREKQKLLLQATGNDTCNVTGDVTVTSCNGDREEKNIYKNISHAHAREEDINPYGDDDYSLSVDTVQQYAMDNIPVMGYRAMEEMFSFVEDLGPEVVRHAIDNALDNGVKTWGYVKSILNKYAEEGVKTVGEAKAIDEQYKKSKQKHEAEPKAETKKAEDMTQEELEYAMNHGPYGKFY